MPDSRGYLGNAPAYANSPVTSDPATGNVTGVNNLTASGTVTAATELLKAGPNAGLTVSSADGTTFKGIVFDTADNQMTVGTQTNHPLVLYTNNTGRVTIDTSGGVTIGNQLATTATAAAQTDYFNVGGAGSLANAQGSSFVFRRNYDNIALATLNGTANFSTASLTTTSTGTAAVSLGSNSAIRDSTNGASLMYFDVSAGGAAHGTFIFRSSNAFTVRMQMETTGQLTLYGAMVAAGSVLINGSGSMGYTTGAGGTVTQTTSKSTNTSLGKYTGQIVTSNAALAANTTVRFTHTTALNAATDTIITTIAGGGTGGAYLVWVDAVVSGGFIINIRNITAGSLSEALTINYAVIKGSAS